MFKQGDKNSDGFILKSGVVGLTREVEGTIVHVAKVNAGEVMKYGNVYLISQRDHSLQQAIR